jgi:hypothetical protein
MNKKQEPIDATALTEEERGIKPSPNTVAVRGAQLPKQDAWKHAAAAALHGWAEHAHHTGKPMELSAEGYEAALKAVEGPGKSGDYEPHPAALSPHSAIAKRDKA